MVWGLGRVKGGLRVSLGFSQVFMRVYGVRRVYGGLKKLKKKRIVTWM